MRSGVSLATTSALVSGLRTDLPRSAPSALRDDFDYAAIGTVSNVASRLCDEAKPGQILISPRVLMAVEGAISVEPVGEFKLKGISRPLATYNVLSAVSAKI